MDYFMQTEKKEIKGVKVKLIGFAGPKDAALDEKTLNNYTKAMDDYDEVLSSFANENYKTANLGKER